MTSDHKLNRALGCLLGGILGLLLTVCLGIGGLLLLEDGGTATVPPAAPPPTYDIEAVIEEDYVNRTMLETTGDIPTPFPVLAGHMDVQPGGFGDFVVQVQIGPLRPIVRGTVALRATEAGQLQVTLTQVQMGALPVTSLVPAGTLDPVNESINRQLTERTGAADVRLIGVASDETTLRFYLIGER
jgi:hypothetical protein